MAIEKTLEEHSVPEMVELYHIVESSETPDEITESLASFKQKGAVAWKTPQCNFGQSNGFFVWTNKEKAFEHSESPLGGLSHLMLIFKIPQSKAQYPEWNIDFEAVNVGPFLKRHEKDVQKLGQIQCTQYDVWGENPRPDVISVQSISDEDGSIKVISQRRGEIILKQNRDLGEIEAIFMKMVRTSPQFLKEYNEAIKKLIQNGQVALKYQGTKPLSVSAASIVEHIYSKSGTSFKEIPIYDSEKKEQVCPFVSATKETSRILRKTKKERGLI